MTVGLPVAPRVVAAEPLGASGASGNVVERVILDDGTSLVRKRVRPADDWISRATGDDGRALRMWDDGAFDRFPRSVDHTTVAVEAEDDGWSVYMRDVSVHMVDPRAVLDAVAVRRVLAAVADLHLAWWGATGPDLCGLEDRYHLLSPRTARRERNLGNPVGDTISRCWEVFAELVPADVASAVLALSEDPAPLAAELASCECTLVHGDVRLTNLGLSDEAVVLVDWGERTGFAPAPVELASFLVFDAERLALPPDEVIAEFGALYGERHDERALHLALIGGMVQLGPNPTLDYVLTGNEDARGVAVTQLAWWTRTVARALETWSPV